MLKKMPGAHSITRRVFLKEALLVLSGITLTPLIYLASCNSAKTTQPAATTEEPLETTPAVTTQVPLTSASTPPPSSSTHTTTTPPASSAAAEYTTYIPSTTLPELVTTPGCASRVATDRLYSRDHAWVKTFGPDKVVIGISDKLQMLLVPINLTLSEVGQWFIQGDTIGSIEGQKLLVDLLSPVSGEIWQINPYLHDQAHAEGVQVIVDDPYGAGWMMVMLLSKPAELKGLLTAQQYIEYSSKIESL